MMADRESARRETARKAYEALQSRPRSTFNAPILKAFFAPSHEGVGQGAENLIHLMGNLVGANPYIQEWRVVRDARDDEAGGGLNPLADPRAFVDYCLATSNEEFYQLEVLAFSQKIFPDNPRMYSAGIGYSGGRSEARFDALTFYCTSSHRDRNLTLNQWAEMIARIIAWREPRMVSVGTGNYTIYDRVFWDRAWDGWMAWLPKQIDPRILPETAITIPMGPGTLVAAQQVNVDGTDPVQKRNANELELSLVDAGVLPTESELMGR